MLEKETVLGQKYNENTRIGWSCKLMVHAVFLLHNYDFCIFLLQRSDIAIIPNTPQYSALLFKVKHLIRITPITLPQGIPDASDLSGARLQENGQLVFVPQLKKDAEQAELQQIQETPSNHMDGETLRKHLRLNWIKPWK